MSMVSLSRHLYFRNILLFKYKVSDYLPTGFNDIGITCTMDDDKDVIHHFLLII